MPSRSQHRRPTAGAILALLALVAQPLLPHLHGWQVGATERAIRVTTPAAGALVESGSAADDAGDHDRAACAVCLALAHARHGLSPAPPAGAASAILAVAPPAEAEPVPLEPSLGHPAPRGPPLLPS
jgi:hypothetical protein